MKIIALVMTGLVSLVLTLRSQEQAVLRNELDSLIPARALQWDDPKWWESMRREAAVVPLGKTDYVVRGPLVDTFRVAPQSPGAGLGRRILHWPIISLFVPQPFPAPARGGPYFAWGERDQPWSMLAERPDAGPMAWLSLSR